MKSLLIMDLESRVTGIVGRGVRRGEIILELEPEGRPEVPQAQKLDVDDQGRAIGMEY